MIVFGDRLPLARQYADLLAGPGIERGLLGPRELPRLWERHLLNCAVLVELLPPGCTVIDVGSGAGLPGIAIGLARPDVVVLLVEPLQRRAAFLEACLDRLSLPGVQLHRGRAEELRGRSADAVTARAVAPLARLVGWCWPLVAPGGQLLAVKGASATAELAAERSRLPSDVDDAAVAVCGAGLLAEPTTVVVLRRRPELRSNPARRRQGHVPVRQTDPRK